MARIMVVDDAAFMRQLYVNMLAETSHSVCAQAANGYEAIAMYEEYRPDLVLLDITMPGISGIDTLKAILERDRGALVVMSSALGQDSFIAKCIQEGAKDFIVKPIVRQKLLEKINDVLNPRGCYADIK